MVTTPAWRTRIAVIVSAIAAIWLGSAIANQEMLWPAVVGGVLGLMVLVTAQPIRVEALLLAIVIFGYIVGNRGFAQLHPPNVPLLPAEIVLMISGAIICARCAQQRTLPIRRDFLNFAILGWIALASVRLYFDVRTFGFMALRDYAMVYYAAFFFMGQYVAEVPSSRRILERSLFGGCTVLAIVFPLFVAFPEVFIDRLAIAGIPLIFFKGDLAGTFLVVGSILYYLRFEAKGSRWALLLSVVFAGGALMTSNRASMLGLLAATALLATGRRWRLAAVQATAGVAAIVIVLFVAHVRGQSWQQTPLHGVFERVISLVDPFGTRTYSADDGMYKGDNNRFRMVWWQTVYAETAATAPFTGLGYGYDLAQQFVEEYYPDTTEEFSTRSPHNFPLTVFARTGVIGFVPFVLFVAALWFRAARACRRHLDTTGLWLTGCIIFVSACFGVVLEGPMGAVVFWTVLGAANAPAPAIADGASAALDGVPDDPTASLDRPALSAALNSNPDVAPGNHSGSKGANPPA